MLYFDKDCDGYINFEEFLFMIRGRPSDARLMIVDKALLKFDRTGSGYIDITDVK